MTTALQNRLVGTIIIVALAVIFLPDFLDREKVTNEDVFVSVPTAPSKKPIVNPEPFPSERVANAAQRPIEIVSEPAVDEQGDLPSTPIADSTPQNNTPATKPVTADDLAARTVIERPKAEEQSVGWVVQLGSFRHQKNVKQLLTKLEGAGYRAFSRPIETSSGPLTKVFVGPELEKVKLENAIPHLQEVTGLKGKVTAFGVN